jgi:hypothetical protein
MSAKAPNPMPIGAVKPPPPPPPPKSRLLREDGRHIKSIIDNRFRCGCNNCEEKEDAALKEGLMNKGGRNQGNPTERPAPPFGQSKKLQYGVMDGDPTDRPLPPTGQSLRKEIDALTGNMSVRPVPPTQQGYTPDYLKGYEAGQRAEANYILKRLGKLEWNMIVSKGRLAEIFNVNYRDVDHIMNDE